MTCENLLPVLKASCINCGEKINHENQTQCLSCQKKKPLFDQLIAAFEYGMPLDFLITRFKFHENLVYGQVLSELLAHKISQYFQDDPEIKIPQVLIPVPLHNARLKERGFNQAVEITKVLSRNLNIPMLLRQCTRVINTAPQTTLKIRDRKFNVRHAFEICWPDQIPESVAIIDDVVTTMATVSELTKTLKQSGVQHVAIWCLARRTAQK